MMANRLLIMQLDEAQKESDKLQKDLCESGQAHGYLKASLVRLVGGNGHSA